MSNKNLAALMVQPSAELAAVIGTSDPLPRTEVTQRLWSYIREHQLQNQQNKRMIDADELLLKVFGDGKNSVNMFEMTSLVNKHMTRVVKAEKE